MEGPKITGLYRVLFLSLLACFPLTSSTLTGKAEGDNRLLFPGIGRYLVEDVSLNWTEAHRNCKELGGHLAVAESETEAETLQGMRADFAHAEVHVGVHDVFGEGMYFTVVGQYLDETGYQTWSPSSVESPDSNCASLVETGLNSIPCTKSLPYICELPMWDDYTLIPEFGYYKLHKEHRMWNEAWEECRNEGSELLIVHSQEEYDAIYALFADQTFSYVMYGAHHMFAYHEFTTVLDEPLANTGYTTWIEGEPGDWSNEDYPTLSLYMKEGFKGMATLYKDAQYSFICKHSLYRTPR